MIFIRCCVFVYSRDVAVCTCMEAGSGVVMQYFVREMIVTNALDPLRLFEHINIHRHRTSSMYLSISSPLTISLFAHRLT